VLLHFSTLTVEFYSNIASPLSQLDAVLTQANMYLLWQLHQNETVHQARSINHNAKRVQWIRK